MAFLRANLIIGCSVLALHGCKTPGGSGDGTVAANDAESGGLVTEVRTELETAEQVCIAAPDDMQDEMAEVQMLKFGEIALQLEDQFKAFGMLPASNAAQNWDQKNWLNQSEGSKWSALLQNTDAAERCRMLETAYVFAVWRLASMPAVDAKTDLANATWALRFNRLVADSIYPPACTLIREKTVARWNHSIAKSRLGFATGKCLRPVSALD